jgi:hypothetical protein
MDRFDQTLYLQWLVRGNEHAGYEMKASLSSIRYNKELLGALITVETY